MRHLKIALLSAAIGAGICLAALRFIESTDTLRAVLWPATYIADAFPPPCFDQGPGQKPFCEGTPVQVLAGVVGLVVTWLLYSTVLQLLLTLFMRRRVTQPDRGAA
jgi:hypothetical protein